MWSRGTYEANDRRKAFRAVMCRFLNQPTSDGLRDGLQPTCDGLQPTSDGLQPKGDGMASNLLGLQLHLNFTGAEQ